MEIVVNIEPEDLLNEIIMEGDSKILIRIASECLELVDEETYLEFISKFIDYSDLLNYLYDKDLNLFNEIREEMEELVNEI